MAALLGQVYSFFTAQPSANAQMGAEEGEEEEEEEEEESEDGEEDNYEDGGRDWDDIEHEDALEWLSDAKAPAKRTLTAQLRHEYEQALEEDDIAISRVQTYLVHHAAKECRILTYQMSQKLPRECIQHILRYLCIEERPIPVGPKFHFKQYGKVTKTTYLPHLATALSHGRTQVDHSETSDSSLLMMDSHIFQREYMGEAGAADALRVYLTNNTFSICNVEDGIAHFFDQGPEVHRMTGLDRRLGKKIFEVPSTLASVRKLQIRVKYEHFFNVCVESVSLRQEGHLAAREKFANERNFLRTSNSALSVLLILPQKRVRKKALDIEFIIMTSLLSEGTPPGFPGDAVDGYYQRPFINLLQALRNTFYTLMYDMGQSKIRIVHHDEDISAFPRDITALWSLTKTQWEQEKCANYRRSDWTTGFYLGPRDLDDTSDLHGAFPATETAALLRERWGVANALRENRPQTPIKRGRYWPVRS